MAQVKHDLRMADLALANYKTRIAWHKKERQALEDTLFRQDCIRNQLANKLQAMKDMWGDQVDPEQLAEFETQITHLLRNWEGVLEEVTGHERVRQLAAKSRKLEDELSGARLNNANLKGKLEAAGNDFQRLTAKLEEESKEHLKTRKLLEVAHEQNHAALAQKLEDSELASLETRQQLDQANVELERTKAFQASLRKENEKLSEQVSSLMRSLQTAKEEQHPDR